MPAIHHQSFKANFYECDAFGFLQNITYLRWMQEAAFGASAAVGYDFGRYNDLHHLWLVRETELKISQPAAYGDIVDIRTYVMDFRRFRSRRVYEFIDQKTQQQIAQAFTEWVYVNAETLHPAKIPAEMQAAFFPGEPPSDVGIRSRSSFPSKPAGKTLSIKRTVHWNEIDQMWHVNNAMYLLYLEEAGHEADNLYGYPLKRTKEMGIRIAPVWLRVEYRLPAVLGDELEVVAWLTDYQKTGVKRNFLLQRVSDNAVFVRAQMKLQWTDQLTGELLPIPTDYVKNSGSSLVE